MNRPYPAAFAVLVPTLRRILVSVDCVGGKTVLGGASTARFVDLHG
jgi:hypothetical protein